MIWRIKDDRLQANLWGLFRGNEKMQDGTVDVIFTSPPYNDSGTTESDKENKRHFKYEIAENREDWYEWQCEVIAKWLIELYLYKKGLSKISNNVKACIEYYNDYVPMESLKVIDKNIREIENVGNEKS